MSVFLLVCGHWNLFHCLSSQQSTWQRFPETPAVKKKRKAKNNKKLSSQTFQIGSDLGHLFKVRLGHVECLAFISHMWRTHWSFKHACLRSYEVYFEPASSPGNAHCTLFFSVNTAISSRDFFQRCFFARY